MMKWTFFLPKQKNSLQNNYKAENYYINKIKAQSSLMNCPVLFVLFATKTTTCYAGGKGKALARKEVTK